MTSPPYEPSYVAQSFPDGTQQTTTAIRTPATAASLASANPTLPPGQQQAESDTGLFKVNYNTTATAYNALPYTTRSFNGVGNPPSGAFGIPHNVYGISAAAATSGLIGVLPFDVWPKPLLASGLVHQVTTAAAGLTGQPKCFPILYCDNGSGWGPDTSLAGTDLNGNTIRQILTGTMSSTGIKITPFATNLLLPPARYWLGLYYYQGGSTAPTTVPQFQSVSGATTLWTPSSTLQSTRFVSRSGYTTAPPTDGAAFSGANGTVPVVGLVAA